MYRFEEPLTHRRWCGPEKDGGNRERGEKVCEVKGANVTCNEVVKDSCATFLPKKDPSDPNSPPRFYE